MRQSDVADVAYKLVLNNLPSEVDPSRLWIKSGNIPNDDVQSPAIVLTHVPASWAVTTLGGEGVCRRRDRNGLIFLQVRTPTEEGMDNLGIKIAEDLGNLFEGRWQDLPIVYTGVELREPLRDGAWFLTNCVITYKFEIVA